MKQQVITLSVRFEYLRKIFNEHFGFNMPYHKFIECIFSKLEQEIRTGSSGLEKYYKKGEGDRLPISDQTVKFKYDYTK